MKKKSLLIISLVVAVFVTIVYFVMKKKKGGAPLTSSGTTAANKTVPAGSTSLINTTTSEAPKTINPAATNGLVQKPSFKVVGQMKEGSRGHTILSVQSPQGTFKNGDKVTVNTDKLKGTFNVWYARNNNATSQNIYIDKPYTGAAMSGYNLDPLNGTVVKA